MREKASARHMLGFDFELVVDGRACGRPCECACQPRASAQMLKCNFVGKQQECDVVVVVVATRAKASIWLCARFACDHTHESGQPAALASARCTGHNNKCQRRDDAPALELIMIFARAHLLVVGE